MSDRDDAETVRWLMIFAQSLAEATDSDIVADAKAGMLETGTGASN